MKTLKNLLPEKFKSVSKEIDEKTVFYIAKKVIIEEYGTRGGENIAPVVYKEKKLVLAARSSLWMSEVSLTEKGLCEKINKILGGEFVREIRMTHH